MTTVYPDHKFCWIHKTASTHFNFLLQRGFRIVSVIFTDQGVEDWQVMMLLDDCFIRLRCDRGRVDLGLSTMQLCNQVGFFDLHTLLQFTFDLDVLDEVPDKRPRSEEQQIEEIARLFKRYCTDIFMKFEALSILILDRVWIISKPNVNGRLSMDNRPFTVYH